jgi:hypothetical protein
LAPQKNKERQIALPLFYRLRRKKLLQIGHRGQVGVI